MLYTNLTYWKIMDMASWSMLVWFYTVAMSSLFSKGAHSTTLIYVKPKLTWKEAWGNCRSRYNGTLARVHRKKTFVKKLAGCVDHNEEFWYGSFSQMSTWVFIKGCYNYSSSLNHSLNQTYTSRPSVMECQSFCGSKPRVKFAIQGYYCECGVDIKHMTRIAHDKCDRQCDRQAFCGRTGYFSVYQNVNIFIRTTPHHKMCVAVRCRKKGPNEYKLSYRERNCDAKYHYICAKTKTTEAQGKWSVASNTCRLLNYKKYFNGNNGYKNCSNLTKNRTYWTGIFRSDRFILDKEYHGESIDPVQVFTMTLIDDDLLRTEYIWRNDNRFSSLCETDSITGIKRDEDVICNKQYVTSDNKYNDDDTYNENSDESNDDEWNKSNNSSNNRNIDDDDDGGDDDDDDNDDDGDDDDDDYEEEKEEEEDSYDDYDDIDDEDDDDNETLSIVNSVIVNTHMKTSNDNVISTQYTLISTPGILEKSRDISFASDRIIVNTTLVIAGLFFILLVILLLRRTRCQKQRQIGIPQRLNKTVTNSVYERNEFKFDNVPPSFNGRLFETTKNNNCSTDRSDTMEVHSLGSDTLMRVGPSVEEDNQIKTAEISPTMSSEDNDDNDLYFSIDEVICDDFGVYDEDRQGCAAHRVVSGEYNIPYNDNYFVLEKQFNTDRFMFEVNDRPPTAESNPATSNNYYILEKRTLTAQPFEFMEDLVSKEIEDETFQECNESDYDHLNKYKSRIVRSQSENIYDHLPPSPEVLNDELLPSCHELEDDAFLPLSNESETEALNK